MKRTRVKFNATALKTILMKDVVNKQTALLVDYAKEKIMEIGDSIQMYPDANHMDRIGNLLNSLCWGVSYQGKIVNSGFYRKDAKTKTIRVWGEDTNESFLHEWFDKKNNDVKYLNPVDGRALAQKYLETYGNNGARGWRVFFAILAPYWGYWEKGFKLKIRATDYDDDEAVRFRFMQFAVMTYYYDKVKADLKPARTRFRVSVAKYKKANLIKKRDKQ